MKRNPASGSLDADTVIANLMHQTEAVIDVDEQRLSDGKRALLSWMEEEVDEAEARPPGSGEQTNHGSGAHGQSSSGERPLNEARFLTVAEVAETMRVSKMTVYRLVHHGHLPSIRFGRSFRVPERAVHEYLRENYAEGVVSPVGRWEQK